RSEGQHQHHRSRGRTPQPAVAPRESRAVPVMTSFSNRNPIPIAIVGITLLFLGTLAALNSDVLPLIGGGTTYRAEFSEAAGLETDDEVRIAGVKVGEVTDIDLDGAKVLVSFKVSDAWIGDETTAAIKIKTLLGRKYLALDPSGDEPLDPNTTIPLERTTAPYDVLEAFRGLSRTVDDIDVNQLARSFDVLSRTFEIGRAASRERVSVGAAGDPLSTSHSV